MRELPMKKAKEKWPVKELMVRGQRRLLKRWLRYAENLKATEEKMIYVCEPETGRGLDDFEEMNWDQLRISSTARRAEKKFQISRWATVEITEDLTDCQEDSQGISHCQLGNERRSLWDLEDCQEGSGSILNCQVGRDENSRPSEGLMDSEVSSIQQGVLMKMGSVDLIVCQEGSGTSHIARWAGMSR
jgi:hypothetical protein